MEVKEIGMYKLTKDKAYRAGISTFTLSAGTHTFLLGRLIKKIESFIPMLLETGNTGNSRLLKRIISPLSRAFFCLAEILTLAQLPPSGVSPCV